MNRARSFIKTIAAACMTLLFAMSFLCTNAFAANATFTVNVPSTSVVPDDTVEISVSIVPGDQAIASYSYSITYDPSLLSYVSGGSSESDGVVSFSGSGTPKETVFTFKAIAPGTASIETAATEIMSTDDEVLSLTPAYNSITISDPAEAAANSEASSTSDTSQTTDTTSLADSLGSSDTAMTEDEVGTLTETDTAEANAPEGTVVTLNSNSNTYYVMNKPDSVDVPDSYIPAKIKLNDADVKAYIKSTNDSTVLLYAASSDGSTGWYFFDTREGTFLNASDIVGTSSSAIDQFMSKNKFVIMLIAIIVLVILIVVIVMLAVSLKGLITDYEAQIDKLKKDNEASAAGAEENAHTEEVHEPIRIAHHESGDVPTINNKALFPGDEEVHESYEDSDYDNKVVIEEEDFVHTDDYDDSAFSSAEIIDDSSESADSQNSADDNAPSSKESDRNAQIKASLDEIDAALESARKYTN